MKTLHYPFLQKKPVHTFSKKRMIILTTVLVISLLSNLILRADLRNIQNNVRTVLHINHAAFFETLEECSDEEMAKVFHPKLIELVELTSLSVS